MEVEVFLHGTPKGYSFIGKSDEFSYCSTFYTNQNENEKLVLELRNIGNTTFCYYTYIKSKNVNSADSRPGVYIALTVRLDYYCRDTIAMYIILKAIYKKHVVGNFVQEVDDTTKYIVESLSSKEGELDNMMRTLVQLLSLQIHSSEFAKIRFEKIPSQNGTVQLSLLDCSNDSVLNGIKKSGKVSISTSYPSARERNLRVELEKEIADKTHMLKLELHHREMQFRDELSMKEEQLKKSLCKKEEIIAKLEKEMALNRRNKEVMANFHQTALQAENSVKKMVSDLRSLHIPFDYINPSRNESRPSLFHKNLFPIIASVLLLIVLSFQIALFFTRNDASLVLPTEQVENLNEDKNIIPMVEEESMQQQTIEDLSNLRLDIRGLRHPQEGLLIGKSYPVAVITTNRQPISNVEGIKWECIGKGAYIKPLSGNEAMLNVQEVGVITIICHLPNGQTIKREIKTTDDDPMRPIQDAPQFKEKRNSPSSISEKEKSKRNDL